VRRAALFSHGKKVRQNLGKRNIFRRRHRRRRRRRR